MIIIGATLKKPIQLILDCALANARTAGLARISHLLNLTRSRVFDF